MKKKLFSAYVDNITKALNNPHVLNESLHRRMGGFPGTEFEKSFDSNIKVSEKTITLSSELDGLEADIGIQPLKDLLGIKSPISISYGDHPDFKHLRTTGGREDHYIVSCFIDVRKSTNLFKKSKNYNHDQIASVIQTIQAAAIHTCSLFGGHIHRLMCDGLFIYFGGKGYAKSTAISGAIKAASFFTYFIKYELPDIFDEYGVENINTRVGIDFGDDKDVSWYVFGVGDCSELTTLSLHTSLAPKMQGHANPNGMVIGNNVLSIQQELRKFTSVITDSKGKEFRYIFTDPYYAQWKLDWEAFLNDTYSFVKKENGNIYIEYQIEKQIAAAPMIVSKPDKDLYDLGSRSKPWFHEGRIL